METKPHNRRLVVRTVLQIAAVVFVLSMVLARSAPIAGIAAPAWWPDLQGICPIAMSRTAAGLVAGTVPPTDRSDLWVLMGAIVAAALAGALFCGWLCPLGSVQEWVGRLGRLLLGRRYNRLVPKKADRALSFLRYAVLGLLVIQTVRFGVATMTTLNPARALMHVWTGGAFVAGLAVLAVVLLGSLAVERPWCRWICPFGALQGLLARVSPWTIRRSESACISCGKCARACPFLIAVDQVAAVRDGRCNRCTHCVAACPVGGGLDYANKPPSIEIRTPAAPGLSLAGSVSAAVLAIALFFLPAGVARATGAWAPQSEATAASLTPEEIGPTMTLSQVASGFGMVPVELLALLEMESDFDPETRLFDIEDDERYEHVTVGWVRGVLSNALSP